MGFKVSVICEDHTLDQFVVRPVMAALLAYIGKPNAQVRVVTSPRIHGYEDLLRQVCELVDRWAIISDVVILAVDTDCEDGNTRPRNKPLSLANALRECERTENVVVVFARQEIEVWALWGIRSQLGVPWAEVLDDCDPKEAFFEPQVTDADRGRPDRGRTRLVASSLIAGWQSIKSGCEELAQLEIDIRSLT